MRADAVRHDHYKAPIIHVQPIASANKFIRGVSRERTIGLSTKVRFVKAGHKSLHLFKRRFEGHFDLICRRLYKCLGETLCLLPNSLHLRMHKLGLYAKRVLKVLRPTQLLYKFVGGGDVFSA